MRSIPGKARPCLEQVRIAAGVHQCNLVQKMFSQIGKFDVFLNNMWILNLHNYYYRCYQSSSTIGPPNTKDQAINSKVNSTLVLFKQ